MGARTREVGGGNAVGVANDFNAFLSNQLRGPNGSVPTGAQQQVLNFANQQTSNAMQPGQQTSSFGNAFQNAMNGQVNDQSGANAAIQNYFANPTANNLNIPSYQNQYSGPQFQQADVNQLATNFGQGQTGMADLSQFGNAAQSSFNPMQGFGQQGSSQFSPQLQQLISAGQAGMNSFSNGSGFNAASAGQDVQMQNGMDYGQAYNTLGQDPLMERNRMMAVADQRARFGAEGAGALGTGAQVAEGNLNAQLNAQDASNRRGQAMQLMGQDLANRSAMAQTGLQNRGQNVQTSIANMQGGLQGQQNQISGFNAQNNALGQLLQSSLSGRGQDFQNQAANRGFDVNQLGMGSQQSMFNAGQQNDMQTALMNGMLQNQGLGNQFGLNAAQLNNNAMQSNNANNINTSQFQNQFNQNNAQNTAQYGQANNALNSSNMTNQAQINNQMLQSMINQGLNLNQMGNQNTQQMLAQLFGAFGQANQLGTAQRQNVTSPSPWGQLAGLGASLGSAWLQGGGGNPFSGGGGGMTTGNVPQPIGTSYPRPTWG